MGNFLNFLNSLEAILNKIYTKSINIILCGDINNNYLDDEDTNKLKLISLLTSYHLCSIVDFPTTVTGISATAMDNFFINKCRNYIFSITSLPNDLSDHDAQILTLNNILFSNQPNHPVFRRVINECTIMEFNTNFSYESWADVFNINDDVNLMFNTFLNIYLRLFNHSFPYKKYFPNKKNQTWITTGIKVSCARKRELYKFSRESGNPELIRYYKKYCKVLTEVIKSAKKCYYNKLMLNSKNKVKTLWGIIRAVTNTNFSKDTIQMINIEGKLCNNV
jgi:hypothetical protein